MKKFAAGVALVALIPICAITTAALVTLDVIATLADLRRGDRAGKWR